MIIMIIIILYCYSAISSDVQRRFTINVLNITNISRLSLIVPVNKVLNRTVVVGSDWRFDNLCGSHLQSQSELYHVSWWYYTLVIDLIGQLRRDVIGRLSLKLWCWLRLTLALLRKRLYRTSEAPLKLLHVYYNLTILYTCCTQTDNHFTRTT